MSTDLGDALKLIFLVNAIGINTILAILVYRNNPRSATNIIYSILSIIISFWLLVLYIVQDSRYIMLSLFWSRMSIFIAAPMSVTFFLFAHTLPHESLQINKKYLKLILFITAIVMMLNISPYAFTNLEIKESSIKVLSGIGILPFGILSTGFSISAVYLLITRWRNSIGIVRQQLLFVLLGILLMLGLIITTIFLPVLFFENASLISLSPLYTLIFLGMTAYAIFRHNLFSVKIVVTEALVVVIWIVLFSKIFVSPSSTGKIIDSLIFAITIFLGVLLIRSVLKEVKQREQLQILTGRLEAANTELKRLDRAKSEFISIAGHQLRTPLTIIKGYVSLSLDGTFGEVSRKLHNSLTIVANSTDQLVKLVSDLLDLSRIEAGKIHYEMKETDFIKMIENIVKEYTPAAKKKGLKLVFEDMTERMKPFFFDPDKIREVVVNLIDNAMKYSTEGTIAVRTELINQDTLLRFSVKDQGMGIRSDDIGRLFVKFNRLEEARKNHPNGSGIGLYVVKCIVEDHHGRVAVTSEGIGKGSTFSIELPVRKASG